jgi:hypothetical protein
MLRNISLDMLEGRTGHIPIAAFGFVSDRISSPIDHWITIIAQ